MNMIHFTSGKDGYELKKKDYDYLIGKSVNEVDLSEVSSKRIIKPGMMVTMDYRTDRLNIHVDDQGVITSVRWG